MKSLHYIRPFFVGLALGVIASSIVSEFALHGRDLHWQTEAFSHHAAVWKTHLPDKVLTFQWLDDYFFEQLTGTHDLPAYTPPPTPENKFEKL